MINYIINLFRRTKPGVYVLFKDKDEKWRFNLVAANREIIATSESYSSKQACYTGIKAVRKIAAISPVEEQK